MTSRALKVPQIGQAELLSFYEAHFSGAATAHFAANFLQPAGSTTAAEPTASYQHEPTNYCENEYGEYQEEEEEEYEEDDDLGYYPDGVKRTLTDEQIAIFRHSEIEALRRKREREGGRGGESTRSEKVVSGVGDDAELSEGEVSEGEGSSTPTAAGGVAVGNTNGDGNGNTNGTGNGNGNSSNNGNRNGNGDGKGNGNTTKKKKKKRKRAGISANNSGRTDEPPVDLRKRTWDVVETGLATLDYDDDEQGTAPQGEATGRKQVLYED